VVVRDDDVRASAIAEGSEREPIVSRHALSRVALRQALAERLFDDEQPALQPDPVVKATRSPRAERKAQTTRNRDGLAAGASATSSPHFALRARGTIRVVGTTVSFDKLAEQTAVQRRALEPLERA
jgi:hypothetical protein